MADDDDVLPVIILGALFLMGHRAQPGASKTSERIPWGLGWTWPVPDLHMRDGQSYPATLSQEFRRPDHLGVDVMYRRRGVTDRPDFPAGTSDGTTQYFAPRGTPILAARDARVWSVISTPRGWEVVLDHGAPFATYYLHLDRVDLEPHAQGRTAKGGAAATIRAGDMFGTMGFDPLDAQKLRHLHFAVWYRGHGNAASIDPADNMTTWKRETPWTP